MTVEIDASKITDEEALYIRQVTEEKIADPVIRTIVQVHRDDRIYLDGPYRGQVRHGRKPVQSVVSGEKPLKAKAASIAMALVFGPGMAIADGAPTPAATASAPASEPAVRRPPPYRSPISVPSAARIDLPPLAGPAVTPGATPAPAFTSTCDSSGCWGSDGTRYNAAGGMLTRPDGRICRDVAGVMQCP